MYDLVLEELELASSFLLEGSDGDVSIAQTVEGGSGFR